MRKLPLLVSFFILFINSVFAQDVSIKFAETIKADELKAHLSIVASDSFEGRGTAERGQKLAANYLAKQFQLNGLKPIIRREDTATYFQSFKVFKRSWDDPYLMIDNNEKKFLKDFFCIGNPGFIREEELEIVYGGQGEEIASEAKSFDVKGKAVVLSLTNFSSNDSTIYRDQIYSLINSSNYSKTYRKILENGAKAIFVVVSKADYLFNNYLDLYGCSLEESAITMTQKVKFADYNVFFIPPSVGAEMLSISLEKLNSITDKKPLTKSVFREFKSRKIKIKASEKVEELETENVIGYLEGTDKKDEVLVISAHYDHEGILCGEIYNGADDDGTGTVSLIELAQAFSLAKKEGKGPRRSILFIAMTGEEKGLLGSKYYTDHPLIPLTQTVADLNIDMIGRIDKFHEDENYIYLIGSNRLSTKLHEISEECNLKYSGLFLDYKYNAPNDPEQFYYRSDHYNFAKHDVPVIFYFSGTHADYHQPTDDVSKILFPKVERTARLIFHTAWELVNRAERPAVDVKKK
jgi:hypothetical protein